MGRFLVVHPHLDIYGGGERVCHNVIKSLVAHGQEVQLLTFNFDPNQYREIMGEKFPEEVVVHNLGKRFEAKPPFTIYKRRHNLVTLLKSLEKNIKYDYLFSTQSGSPFEPVFLKEAKKNVAYVHFPEIHYDYDRSTLKRKVYLWIFKKWVENGVKKLDIVFCNSDYTKGMIERYWGPLGVQDPIIVYPPVNLDAFWCDIPLGKRRKRVVYVGRFIPRKRHELMKRLAGELPEYEFVSIGGVVESEKTWLERFSENAPRNYALKPNLPGIDMIKMLQESRVYVHLMEGEHFGIAPIEALASGCVTLVHKSGGTGEFVPEEFRWQSYDHLKEKIIKFMETETDSTKWENTREELWRKISILNPNTFQSKIWSNIEPLVQ